jgi:hypothetical protein
MQPHVRVTRPSVHQRMITLERLGLNWGPTGAQLGPNWGSEPANPWRRGASSCWRPGRSADLALSQTVRITVRCTSLLVQERSWI